MPNVDAKWTIDLSQPSGDKSVPRTAVGKGLLSELTGHDGSLQGGVRPHPGFRFIKELNFDAYDHDADGTNDNQYDLDPYEAVEDNHDQRSEVTDIFPVTFMRGTSSTCYGYVYRAKRHTSAATNGAANIDFTGTGTQVAGVQTLTLNSGGTYPAAVDDQVVTVRDMLGNSEEFVFRDDGSDSTGTVNNGQVVVQIQSITAVNDVATQLKNAIDGASAINVTATVSTNVVTVTQDIAGAFVSTVREQANSTTSNVVVAVTTPAQDGLYTGKTLVLTDNSSPAKTVTFTGTNALSSGGAKVSATAYNFSTRGASQTAANIVTALTAAIDLADTNSELDIEATASTAQLQLSQDTSGAGGNTAISGTLIAANIVDSTSLRFTGGSEGSLSDVFIEYYDTKAATHYSPNSPHAPGADAIPVNYTANLLMMGCSSTEPMQVKTLGRLVYVFVRGRSPSVFFLDGENDPDSANFRGGTVFGVTGDTSSPGQTGLPGPGIQPSFKDGDGGAELGAFPRPLDTSNQAGVGHIQLAVRTAEDEEFFALDQPSFVGEDGSSTVPTSAIKRTVITGDSSSVNIASHNYGSGGTPLTTGQRLYVVVSFTACPDGGVKLSKATPGFGETKIQPYAEVYFSTAADGTGTAYHFTPMPTAFSKAAENGGLVSETAESTDFVYDYIQVFESPSFTDLKTTAFGGDGSQNATNLYAHVRTRDGDGNFITNAEMVGAAGNLGGMCVRVFTASNVLETQGTAIANGGNAFYSFTDMGSDSSGQRTPGIATDGTQEYSSRFLLNATRPVVTQDFKSHIIRATSYITELNTSDLTSGAYGSVIDAVNYGVAGAELIEADFYGSQDDFNWTDINSTDTRTNLSLGTRTVGSDTYTTIANMISEGVGQQAFEGENVDIRLGTPIDSRMTIKTFTSDDPTGDGTDDYQARGKAHSCLFELVGAKSVFAAGQTEYAGSDTAVLDFLGNVDTNNNVNTGFLIEARLPLENAENVSNTIKLKWGGRFSGTTNAGRPEIEYDVYWRDGLSDNPALYRVNGQRLTEEEFDIASLYTGSTLPSGREFEWAVTAYATINGTEYYVSSGVFNFTTDNIFDASRLKRGNYAFAYQLFDSKTGRMSSMSQIARVERDGFALKPFGRDASSGREFPLDDPIRNLISRYVVTARGRSKYAAAEIVYDSTKYDHCFFYRSPKTEEEGKQFAGSTLFLDKMVKLEDYHTLDNKTTTQANAGSPVASLNEGVSNRSRAIFYYTLNDEEILYRPFYSGPTRFDEKMPFSGAAEFLDNILIQADIDTEEASANSEEAYSTDAYRGGGETKYSQTDRYAPELHPPANQYTPSDPGNRLKLLKRVGPNVVGLSSDRMYHFRREGTVVVREFHEGLVGTVGAYAADVAASQLFVVSPKGVKIIGTNGSLDNMTALDLLIKETFIDGLENMRVAFDSYESALYFFHPGQKRAAIAWFETSCMTELQDLPFTDVKVGDVPRDETFTGAAGYAPDWAGDRVKRAVFLQNHPDLANLSAGTTWKPKLFVANNDRTRKVLDHDGSSTFSQNIGERRTLLDITGRTHYSVGSYNEGTNTLFTNEKSSLDTDARSTPAENSYIGAFLYCIEDSTTPTNVGTKSQIKSVASSGTNVNFEMMDNVFRNLSSTAKVGVSPVFMEITAHQLGTPTRTTAGVGEIENVHNLKQIDDMKATFLGVNVQALISGIDTQNGTTAAKFQGIIYEGNDDAPEHKAIPVKPDETQFRSIVDGSSTFPVSFGGSDTFSGVQGPLGFTLTPGIRIFTPDVDFRLISFRCSGQNFDTESSEVYTQS